MRYMVTILFALALLCSSAKSGELIRGVLSFDPPSSLHQFFAATNVEIGGLGPVCEFHTSEYSLEGSLLVDLRKVESSDVGGLRTDLLGRLKAAGRATNIVDLDVITIGGQPATGIAFQRPDSGRKHTIEFIEIYWVKVAKDRIVEISLFADTPERLQILRENLNRFTFAKKTPNTVLEPTAYSAFSLAGSHRFAMPLFGGGSAFGR